MDIVWVILIVIVIILIFIYNGFRTRCPHCGDYSLHPKDEKSEQKQREAYENAKTVGLVEFVELVDKPGYTNSRFICRVCSHHFSRKESLTWLTISNKLGEEKAITEYRKVSEIK